MWIFDRPGKHSAYALLSALRVDSAAPEEDRALFALLMTQAMHKTYRLWENSEEENPREN